MTGGTAVLFAYGTLLDVRRLAEVMGPACRWRVLGPGRVAGRLYDLGSWPALRPARSATDRVPGLLIEVSPAEEALHRLDSYEDVAEGIYRRRRAWVNRPGKAPLRAWVYEYRRPVRGRRRIRRWMAGGSSESAAPLLTGNAEGA